MALCLLSARHRFQELTVRLGLITGRGHGELIRERFGKAWAWVSVSTLALACIGALVTEFSELGSVGQLFGMPLPAAVLGTALFMAIVVWAGSYRNVECWRRDKTDPLRPG